MLVNADAASRSILDVFMISSDFHTVRTLVFGVQLELRVSIFEFD